MTHVMALTAMALLATANAPGPTASDYAADAVALDKIVLENYAYEDHWPGGRLPDSPELKAERTAVHDHDSLLHYAEDRIASLADHHAITGSSFDDSWAIVPTYADLWIARQGGDYVVEQVKPGSPAELANIEPGDRLVAVSGVPVASAVKAFWDSLGLELSNERADYAARVLAAGRRDRPRDLTFVGAGSVRRLTLPSLYSIHSDRPLVTVQNERGTTIIRISNSLGEQGTIAAFDSAMSAIPDDRQVVIDLTDTPSGGNSSVARAMMSWFVKKPSNYQLHQLPAEERETGIRRQWIEQVVPRARNYNGSLPVVRVGRWTGSMGEGIAIGFAALGARVEGTRMSQLKGAVYDFDLPSSGLVVKVPAERLYTIDSLPRENFVPQPPTKITGKDH